MGTPEDVHARLSAALDVPILLPEQVRIPLDAAPLDGQGRPMVGGGERGLGVYLKRHPAGYVQLEPPIALTDDGTVGLQWVTVAAIATTAAQAEALTLQARLVLAGTSRDPGRYRAVSQQSALPVSDGIYSARITYDILTVDGVLAV